MNESWTVNEPDALARDQAIWDALASGDAGPALDSHAPGVIFDNGPGAGPWRHTEGREAFVELMMKFLPIFGDSFHQAGTCVFANEQFRIALVAETGRHATSGDVFDNRAIYISRLDADGNVERVWTVDLDSEAMEEFWGNNPVADA
jgi:hypothetical protein